MIDGEGGGGSEGTWSSCINPDQVQILVRHLLFVLINDTNTGVGSVGFLMSWRKYKAQDLEIVLCLSSLEVS